MDRIFPVYDPKAAPGEKTGFIRTESFADPASTRSGRREEPGFTMWAGPKAIVVNAVLPEIDSDGLKIDIQGMRLVFKGSRRSRNGSKSFSHAVELPYRVDADGAEVRRENGWFTIVLRKKELDSNRGNGRRTDAIPGSAKRSFGNNGSKPRNRLEEDLMMKALDRYFAFLQEKGALRERKSP